MDPMFTSPKRSNGYVITPDGTPYSPALSETGIFPWNWGTSAQKINFTPSPGPTAPEQQVVVSPCEDSDKDRLRRGRPRTETISSLIVKGTHSDSNHKCNVCGRNFPREKSLQAHMRTHTGERPYICDYPGCGKSFCQSGQLKTHQRLHTGEKPFKCSAPGCNVRFTHANRHCSSHPNTVLKRDDDGAIVVPEVGKGDITQEVHEWFIRYMKRRRERSTPMKPSATSKRPCIKRSLSKDIENQWIQHKRPHQEITPPTKDDLLKSPGVSRLNPVDYSSPFASYMGSPKPILPKTSLPDTPETPISSGMNPPDTPGYKLTPLRSITPKRLPLSPSKNFNVNILPTPPKTPAMGMLPPLPTTPCSPHKEAEHRETIMGALALMELANGKL